jgi:hypothetical protein
MLHFGCKTFEIDELFVPYNYLKKAEKKEILLHMDHSTNVEYKCIIN